MIGYRGWVGIVGYLQRALHASTVEGVDILTSAAGGWGSCPWPTDEHELAVKEILDNGTIIIMPAGNGDNGTHNTCAAISPYHTAFFPLSPYYDERIILVSGTDTLDKHYRAGGGTQSHYPDVDLCAPGHDLVGLRDSSLFRTEVYTKGGGTSFSAPLVASIAALVLAENPPSSALAARSDRVGFPN